MNRVLEALPVFYQGIREFNVLSTEQADQLDKLQAAFAQIENDQFILTSSESAIARREKDFRIIPDRRTETLDFRKRRLLARMRSRAPYTLRYLRQLLDSLLGSGKHSIDLDVLLFDLEVLVNVESSSFYNEVVKLLERVVPLNMTLETAVVYLTEYLLLRCESYDFSVEYKVTGKFHTAALEGSGRSMDPLVLLSEAYAFLVRYQVTGKMRTAASPGWVAQTSVLETKAHAYAFETKLPVVTQFRAATLPGGAVPESRADLEMQTYAFQTRLPVAGKYVMGSGFK